MEHLLSYDPETGKVHWKVDVNNGKTRAGTEAGYEFQCSGIKYRRIKIGRKAYPTHRVAWRLMTGEWPAMRIDHRDGDGLNNRWVNLREATGSQNATNTKVRSDCYSGVNGVHFDAASHKWRVVISVDGKKRTLGRYQNKDEAIAARRAAERQHYGEFVRQ